MADLADVLSAPNGAGIIRVPQGTTITAPVTVTAPVKLIFEPGTYFVAAGITIKNTAGVIFEGSGAGHGIGTVFSWIGSSTNAIFTLINAQFCYLHDFAISSSVAFPLQCAIKGVDAVGGISTQNRFARIVINGTHIGGLYYGLRFGVGAFGNNDLHSFEDVLVTNYSIAGCSLEGSQVKGLIFRNCGFNAAAGLGLYGITTALGGSFSAFGITGGNNTVADFYLSVNDAILIASGNFEGSARLLETAGQGSAGFAVTVQGVRWSGIKISADGKAIKYTHRGPLNLIGNLFENDGANEALELNLDPSSTCAATAIGNVIGSTLANPFTGNTWTKIGNLLRARNGSSMPTINVIP